jgi:fructokinase
VDRALRLGVDLGGTKTEAVVLRLGGEEPEVLARVRVPTGREEGYEHVVATTAGVIAEATAQAGLASPPPVGVGMPGSVTHLGPGGLRSEDALTKNANTTCLNGRPFRSDLARASGLVIWRGPSPADVVAWRSPSPAGSVVLQGPSPAGHLVFANDANCFALAEATYGAARDARVAFGVILGTGVGGGLVFREQGAPRVWDGAQGIAGEWGHVTLDPTLGPPCYCGRRGCIEQYLSGPAIESAYERRTGTRRSVRDIGARAAGDADARATLAETVEVFGRAVATVLNILDPDTVVLGGGVSNLEALYEAGPQAIARWIFNDELRTRIVKHTLGDSAGVIGAALLL